jgi:acyl-CoA synthetase (AMP-forming)/AMP-acid ligase II
MPETLYQALKASAAMAPDNPFICVPAGPSYAPAGLEWTYREVEQRVEAQAKRYRAAGYGVGHRIALLLDNRPDHFVHLLALNAVGASAVPVNPDYRHSELTFQMAHSDADLAICLGHHIERMRAVADESRSGLYVIDAENSGGDLPHARRPAREQALDRNTEAAVFYTSGTTGRPKGCIVTNDYWLTVGEWFIALSQNGGWFRMEPGKDRLFNPMPVFHVHAGVVAFAPMLLSQGCLIRPDYFQAKRWWRDIIASRATIAHYIGVVPQALLAQQESAEERNHQVRWGFGAGMEPSLHARFEARFGFPHIEVWGMTEIGRWLADDHEPRSVSSRAIGRPFGALQARVVDEEDKDVPRGAEGELLVRLEGPNPRRGFFAGYLNDEAVTEAGWRNGWWHSGDVVRQDASGMIYFVDRKKHLIRRSGENISAAEIEALLYGHPSVGHAAVLPVLDEIRGEEVLACIVPKLGCRADASLADELFLYCLNRLAYYKAPGWIIFLEQLPMTPTQKVSKTQIFAEGVDPRRHSGALDLRARKRRTV